VYRPLYAKNYESWLAAVVDIVIVIITRNPVVAEIADRTALDIFGAKIYKTISRNLIKICMCVM